MAAQVGSLATTHLGAADTVTKENTMAGTPMGGTLGTALGQGALGPTQGGIMGTALQNRQMFNANNGGPGGSGVNEQRQNILGLMARQPSASEEAFSAAHQGFPGTPYAPGYQQNWQNNFNAQQQMQQPPQTTGQQITDPETGRNFTVGGPMTMDMNTGLAYNRAMEAFNQSSQQNQQPGGQAPLQQVTSEQIAEMRKNLSPQRAQYGLELGGQAQQVGQINPGAANQMPAQQGQAGLNTGFAQMPMVPDGAMRSTSMMGPDGQFQTNYGMATNQPVTQNQQANPNINQSSANWINQAAQGTQAGMNYMPERVGFGGYTPFVGVGGSVPNVSAGGATERVSVGQTMPQVGVSGQTERLGDTGQQQRINAGQISQTDLQQYINPYTQQVIDTSMADLERQRQMQQNDIGAQASRAGAFGGSRQGVAEALTNEAFARTGAQTAANLRQQGFQQAQQAAGQDIGYRLQSDLANQAVSGADLARQLQANLANQSASGQDIGTQLQAALANQSAAGQDIGYGLQAGLANQSASAGDLARLLQAGMANQGAAGQNIGFGMQASLANQAARQADLQRMMQGNQFNATTGLAGAQQRLGAAQQLSGIAGQGFNMGQTLMGNLSAQGAQQQALQQALIDAARGQYSGFMGAPAQSLGYMGSALGVTPTPQTTTATRQPGLFDYLTLGSYASGGR
jgi:hypothetical protein